MTIVIALAGLAGSGKSTLAKHLKSNHEFEFLTFSDFLKTEAERRGVLKGKSLEEQKLELAKFGNEWRRETGKMEIVATKVADEIKRRKLERVIVDGARSLEEVKYLKNLFPKFYLVAIKADVKNRFIWKKQDPKADMGKIKERDKMDVEEKGLGKVMEMADYNIDNGSTVEHLLKEGDKIVEEVTC